MQDNNYQNLSDTPQQPTTANPTTAQQQILIQAPEQQKSNGIGTAGFILALLGLFLSWVPVLGWILWLLGLIFSFIGVFKRPKGLSIAGLVISLIGFIILIVFIGALGAALAAA